MDINPLEQIKSVIQSSMRAALEQKKQAKSAADQLYLEGRMDTLQSLLKASLSAEAFIKKEEEPAMKDVKSLVSKGLWLEELPVDRARGELDDKILEAVKELDSLIAAKRGNAVQINADTIKYNHLRNKVMHMQKQKKIPDTIRVFKAGDVYGIAYK
jgi:DNA mismatch repair ATPase MutS